MQFLQIIRNLMSLNLQWNNVLLSVKDLLSALPQLQCCNCTHVKELVQLFGRSSAFPFPPSSSFGAHHCQITHPPVSLPFAPLPVWNSVVPSRRNPPVCVRAPAQVHHARRQTARQHEGGGGGRPAAVCDPAESAGGRIWVRSGDVTEELLC